MHISFNLENFKVESSKEYVFRVQEDKKGDKTITAERKGVCTWIRAHIFCPKEYRLKTILEALKALPEGQNIRELETIKKRIDIVKYQSSHQKAEDIQRVYERVFPLPPVSISYTPKAIGIIAAYLADKSREKPLKFTVKDQAYVAWHQGQKGNFCFQLKKGFDNEEEGFTTLREGEAEQSVSPKVNACLEALWLKTPDGGIRQSVEAKLDDASRALKAIDMTQPLPRLVLQLLKDYLEAHHNEYKQQAIFKRSDAQINFWISEGKISIVHSKIGLLTVEEFSEDNTQRDSLDVRAVLQECQREIEERIKDQIGFHSPKEQPLSAGQLITLQKVLSQASTKIEVTHEERVFVLYHSYEGQNNCINIQAQDAYNKDVATGHLQIRTDDDGMIDSVLLNHKRFQKPYDKQVPDRLLPLLKAGYKKALEESSRYTNTPVADPSRALWPQPRPMVYINVFRGGLGDVAEHHLLSLQQNLRDVQSQNPRLQVTFLREDLRVDFGIDAGGLSRDYLGDIFNGLTTKSSLYFEEKEGLYIPCLQDDMAVLGDEQQQLYEAMGYVLMFCYQSDGGSSPYAYLTGQYLHPGVIAAAMQLSTQEIGQSFTKLSDETKLKLIKVLLEKKAINNTVIQHAFDYLSADARTDQEAQNLAQEIDDCVTWGPELLGEDGEFDIQKVTVSTIEKYLWLLVAKQLAPIHAIARGMETFLGTTAWFAFTEQAPENVNSKIQGSLNREKIAQQIVNQTPNPIIGQKIEWLKEWIKGDATEKEIKDFIKFATGSSALPSDRQIQVVAQLGPEYVSAAYAHTCFYRLDLCPHYIRGGDNTKENFIKSMQAALGVANEYSMS
jgi:hypothetical protein